MRVPQRRSEQNRKYAGDADNLLSAAAVQELREELERLEKARPRIVEELSRTRDMGDLSENAAYQDAKRRLAGTDGRIQTIKEKLKNAVLIEPGADPEGRIRVGAKVVVEVSGKRRSYEITGSQETDPAGGKISHLSPLGAALLNRRAGETAIVETGGKRIGYLIIEVD